MSLHFGVVIKYISLLLILCSCSSRNLINSSVDNAKENINTIVSLKPECKDVGDTCKRELDNIQQICIQTLEKEKDDSWKRGFKTGIIFTGVIIMFLLIMLKRFKL